MDRQIQFRRAALVDDGFAKIEVWADHGDPVWAERLIVSDGERWRAQTVEARITVRFRIRWSEAVADIGPRDRLVCEGQEHEITGVKEIGRRRGIEISAAARADLQ